MRTALGYVRVSTDKQAERGLGLEAQRQRIRAYCEMKGLHLTTIFEDPGLSGGKPLGSRSAGGRLLAEARRIKPVVVVAKLDRLFRSVADAAQTICEFDRHGTSQSLPLNDDPHPTGESPPRPSALALAPSVP